MIVQSLVFLCGLVNIWGRTWWFGACVVVCPEGKCLDCLSASKLKFTSSYCGVLLTGCDDNCLLLCCGQAPCGTLRRANFAAGIVPMLLEGPSVQVVHGHMFTLWPLPSKGKEQSYTSRGAPATTGSLEHWQTGVLG